MNGQELLTTLRSLGVEIELDGGDILLSPTSAVTPELRQQVVEFKFDIITAVQHEPPLGGHLLDQGRQWIPPPLRPGWCPCDEGRVSNAATGLCRICFTAVFGPRFRPDGSAP